MKRRKYDGRMKVKGTKECGFVSTWVGSINQAGNDQSLNCYLCARRALLIYSLNVIRLRAVKNHLFLEDGWMDRWGG